MRLHYWRGGRTMSCSSKGKWLLMLTLSVVIVLGQLTDSLNAQSTAAPARQQPQGGKDSQHQQQQQQQHQQHNTNSNIRNPNTDVREEQDAPMKPPPQVVEAFEQSLLKMFGLSSRPRPGRKVHIPQYMLDLYHSRQADYDSEYEYEDVVHEGGEEEQLSDSDTNSDDSYSDVHGTHLMYSANTIRSYLHSEEEESRRHHGDIEHSELHYRRRFYFNVSNLAPEEALAGAEFRLYRQTLTDVTLDDHVNSAQQKQNSDIDTDSTFKVPKPSRVRNSKKLPKQRIDIYEVISPATQTREAITILLDTRVVDPKRTSWEAFDVRPAVLKWRDAPYRNHGLEVHVRAHSGDSLPAPTGSQTPHVRLRRSAVEEDRDEQQQWSKSQPLLVTYSDDSNDRQQERSKSRNRRRARHKKRRTYSKRFQKNECRRHNLYVDFGDVGWDDWIVAPVGYDAFYCHGECGFPLPEHMNTTNHAIVQTLVHSVNPKQVPRPCCVPTELSPISMLYLDETDKVVLKNYQDMQVVGCGCR